ncbi:hypothetical protein Lal_00031841, partial [Lupinus albus]
MSDWVRDLAMATHSDAANKNWFWNVIVCCIGDGTTTSFWHDCWSGTANLFSRFRRLYNVSLLSHNLIRDFRSWELNHSKLHVNKPDYREW